MGNVQDQRGLPRHDLEPGKRRLCQAGAHVLRGHRYAAVHGGHGSQYAGGIDELVGATHLRLEQAAVAASPARPAPLLAVAFDEIAPVQPEVGPDAVGMVGQRTKVVAGRPRWRVCPGA